MPVRTLFILNPASRRGADRFGRLAAQLRSALGDVEVVRTQAPLDAVRLAREAARTGFERLIVGGGDGTLSEVATGVLEAGLGQAVEIGLVPLGSGCDFARSVGVPAQTDRAIAQLSEGDSRLIDAGRITRFEAGQAEQQSYFLNEAGFGLSGMTVELVRQAGKRLGPRMAFAVGTVRAIVRGETPEVQLSVDGEVVHEGPVELVVCGNGRYFGSGMRIVPQAVLDDGQFDLVVVEKLGRGKLLSRFPSLYRGTHLKYPEVQVYRGQRIEAQRIGGGLARFEADGEPLGRLPVRLDLLPGAIRFFGVSSSPGPAFRSREKAIR